MTRRTIAVLLGTDKHNVRFGSEGDATALIDWASTAMFAGEITRWAVYRKRLRGEVFHNSTDERFLIAHDDPYWDARGVER